MRASIHLSDVGARSQPTAARLRKDAAGTDGLRHARVLTAAPLPSGPGSPPQLGRLCLVAFWVDDAAIDVFERSHPLAELLQDGWSARLDLRRAVPVAGGHFYGVDDDIPDAGEAGGDEPVAVLTIGHLKLPRLVPFLRASHKAEQQSLGAEGMIWETGLANIPQRIVSTFSLWESGTAAHRFALAAGGAHTSAIGHERRRSFHHAGSFLRFAPYAVRGHLTGRNPLPESVNDKLRALPTQPAMPDPA